MEQVAVFEQQPPFCNTGVEMTEPVSVAVHWLRGTTVQHGIDDVLGYLAGALGQSVEVSMFGRLGYSDGYRVGPVEVWHHPEQPQMGVCVEVNGGACDILGSVKVAEVWAALGLRASRLDLAADNCPFTPEQLWREWLADNVRTRVKKLDPEKLAAKGYTIRPGLENVRAHEWHESMTGSTLDMGSRSSSQFARVYDRRGFTRFELELKGRTAAVAADYALGALLGEGVESFAGSVLGLVRRFVDFVDAPSAEHASRRELLPFWAAFVAGVEKATLSLGEVAERTLDDVFAWLERQAGPALALVASAAPGEALRELVARGRRRLGARHQAVLERSAGWAVPQLSV